MSRHSFDPAIAKRVGINAAVIFQNIVWWTEKNAANGKHQHEGRFWTYNSIAAFEELFPYLTGKQIRVALDKLEEAGLLLSGNFNQSSYDRTKWYSPICPEGLFHLPQKANEFALEGEPIPDSKPVTKPVVNILYAPANVSDEVWADFVAMRKAKKAPITQTAIKRIANEAEAAGWSLENALGECVARGWQSFKAEWVKEKTNGRIQKRDGVADALDAIIQSSGISGSFERQPIKRIGSNF